MEGKRDIGGRGASGRGGGRGGGEGERMREGKLDFSSQPTI